MDVILHVLIDLLSLIMDVILHLIFDLLLDVILLILCIEVNAMF